MSDIKEKKSMVLRVGDTVIILTNKQVGKIVAEENGKYLVSVGKAEILCESSDIAKRQELYG